LAKGDHRGIDLNTSKFTMMTKGSFRFISKGIPLVPPFEKKGGHLLILRKIFKQTPIKAQMEDTARPVPLGEGGPQGDWW